MFPQDGRRVLQSVLVEHHKLAAVSFQGCPDGIQAVSVQPDFEQRSYHWDGLFHIQVEVEHHDLASCAAIGIELLWLCVKGGILYFEAVSGNFSCCTAYGFKELPFVIEHQDFVFLFIYHVYPFLGEKQPSDVEILDTAFLCRSVQQDIPLERYER